MQRIEVNLQTGEITTHIVDVSELPPPIVKTLEEQAEDVRIALQSAIDAKAKTFNFSSGNALMLYAGFINPFQALAQQFAVWEASVWYEAESYRQRVIAGELPMLSPEEAVALMPVYPS